MKLAGVDGCPPGWVVATADAALAGVAFSLVETLTELFREASGGDLVVAIDMPIGLAATGARLCDREARALLGFPRQSSVFAPPCRSALAARDYREACTLNAAACGRMLSKQSYNLLPKIREIDQLISPRLQNRVREAHPELIFAALAGNGRGLMYAKKTAAGEAERLALLAGLLPQFDTGTVTAIRTRLGAAKVARDDIVDAAACLIAAHRIAHGNALVLPEAAPCLDARGLRMEIVA